MSAPRGGVLNSLTRRHAVKVASAISLKADTVPVKLTNTSCTCTAGKALCNHLVAMFFQMAHFSMMQMQTVPPTMASTSMLQTWYSPRTQGIAAETVDQLVVKKMRISSRSECKSTLYRAYTGNKEKNSLLETNVPVESMMALSSGQNCLNLYGMVEFTSCLLIHIGKDPRIRNANIPGRGVTA
ncbi:hypothetical protein ROHU_029083 [Labeo rohita]|uniref:SWIM-type domain-containing protein n=1 Tax=Labeo rohita TaxID=84645 RepID=A0A498M2H4_LABRO|nr:hypothetical protein ROHU_029083 [Labeo rohita]